MINNNLGNKLNNTWLDVGTNLKSYPTAVNVKKTVISTPSNAIEILINHNTLGDILISRKGGVVFNSYYLDQYYNIKTMFQWTNGVLYYTIQNLGSSEVISDHYINWVKYK